ncbi:alpha-hydroxy acid oxidase [Pseudonocardia ailaonensis]|uniref:Alpha-hydroxy acid oxidase n=1 Tax=Pseudonocardia ailaonensis TaxID=367279 RepID=A0ABN2N414_9PSEU
MSDRLLSRREPVNVEDVRGRARRVLPRILFDFIDGGAGDELTQSANRTAFARVPLDVRSAVAVGTPDLRTTVLGQEVSLPVLLAPCGGVALYHPDAGRGVTRAATAAGTIAGISTLSGELLEDGLAPGDTGRHWFQLYKLGGAQGARALVDRAAAAGYRALVVTVDTPLVGVKERDVRNGGVTPGGSAVSRIDLPTVLRMGPKVVGRPAWLRRFVRAGMPLGQPNVEALYPGGGPAAVDRGMAAWRAEPFVWADLAWLRERWPGPIVVKGVLGARDARRCVEEGADAVLVSNHGGRQLDGVPATLDVLPGIVDEVGGEIEVYLDGGVRRGADVVRALALGARAVFVGRPYLYGLACEGERGVARVLEMFRAELTHAMILLGCTDVRELDRTWLVRS